jgi:DNA-binding YbaB/EbfC family protein
MPGIDINYFIRQANKLSEKIEERKKELTNETMEGRAGDGRVVAVATGGGEIKSLKIDPAAVDPSDPAMLEDLIIAAVNAALAQSRERVQSELAKISGGIKIPGLT